ncbi:MAG: hypothetical protein AB7W16_23420 [Candidatus Obscuribacterales bacterium]
MKRAIQALGALALMAGFFAAAPAAHAADWTGDCESAPSSHVGNMIINDSDSCTITHTTVTATGYIRINAVGSVNVKSLSSTYNDIEITSGGTTDTENLTANGYHVKITSPSGKVTVNGNINALNYAGINASSNDVEVTGTITANYSYVDVRGKNVNLAGKVTSTTYGNILLFAKENLKTVDIEGAPGYVIDLKARRDTGSAQFVIGGSGQDNGVNGQITAHPGADSPYYASTIISISNGTGGINLSDASKLSVAATSSYRAGYIILDAKNGTLTMPGASLSASGNGTKGAGVIVLVADTINFGNNATVDASQATGISGTLHGVLISAETINYNGLTLKGDGDGVDQYSNGYVQVFPKGGVTIDDEEDPLAPYITAVINWGTQADITLNGTSPLNISANGDYARTYFEAKKTTFSGSAAVTIESKGKNSHKVEFNTTAPNTGSNGVFFTGTGAVVLDTTAEASGEGGEVNFYVDKISVTAPTISIKADGPSSGNGNGGKVYIGTYTGFELDSSSKATISANASSAGNGNAVYSDLTGYDPKAITLWGGSSVLKLGNDDGEILLSAKGGSSGGRGGAIVVSGNSVQLYSEDSVNASAQAGDSDGGGFLSWANITSVANGLNNPVINAVGKGTGKGGKVQSYLNSTGFDVNKYIKVDGGQDLLGSSENDFGRITLNSIACQQRTTGQTSSWPKAYWNCANPDGSVTGDGDMRDAVVGLPSSFKTTLGNHNVQLYIMDIGWDFDNFFMPTDTITTPIGYSLPSEYEAGVAVIFEATVSIDESDYKPGNMMHEVGHLLNAYMSPAPTSTMDWAIAKGLTEIDMKGTWPSPQYPTCTQVFNSPAICNTYPNISPWEILKQNYIKSQSETLEVFAYAFQECSGHNVESPGLNNAEESTYMRDVRDYIDLNVWPGGCP